MFDVDTPYRVVASGTATVSPFVTNRPLLYVGSDQIQVVRGVGGQPVTSQGVITAGNHSIHSTDTLGFSSLGKANGEGTRGSWSSAFQYTVTFGPSPDQIHWNTSSGTWSLASNWDPQTVPDSGKTAFFSRQGAYTVTLDQNARTTTAQVLNGQMSLRSEAFRYHVNRALISTSGGSPASLHVFTGNAVGTLAEHGLLADQLVVGANGRVTHEGQAFVGHVDFPVAGPFNNQALTDIQARTSLLIKDGGTMTSTQAKVDGPSAANGSGIATARIQGAGSMWDVGNLFVGEQAVGQINISDGGELKLFSGQLNSPNESTESVITVNNGKLHAADLAIGRNGKGRVNADGGSQVSIDSVVVGENSGSIGQLVIDGAGTVWGGLNTPARVTVSRKGKGELLVSNGATLNASLSVGELSNNIDEEGNVVVISPGTQVNAAEINVGLAGIGTLSIFNGAQATAQLVNISDPEIPGGHGLITVAGSTSKLTAELRLIVSEFGSLLVTDRGIVDVSLGVLDVNPAGIVENNSGGLITTGAVNIGSLGRVFVNNPSSLLAASVGITMDHGELQVADGGAVTIGTISSIPGRVRVGNDGILAGSGFIFTPSGSGGVSNFGGSVVVGNSPGTLTIEGDYIQGPDGTLVMEIGGLGVGDEYDQLIVTGDAVLDGVLDIVFIDGFAPQAGQSFDLIMVDGLTTESFDQINILNLAPGFQFEFSSIGGETQFTALTDGEFIPEPSSGVLIVLAMTGMGMTSRRKWALR